MCSLTRDCTSGPGRVLLDRPAHGIDHVTPAPVDAQRTPASVAKPAQLEGWPGFQGGVGHALEFVATDTACGLHGDAEGQGADVPAQ